MLIATIVRVTGHAYRADITDASAVFVCEFYTNFIVRFFLSATIHSYNTAVLDRFSSTNGSCWKMNGTA